MMKGSMLCHLYPTSFKSLGGIVTMHAIPAKTAGIIIVGDEILKGQVRDSNSYFMSKRLRAIGTKVVKMSVVEDNIDDIAKTVKEFSQRFDLVLTSGGIGPTHDDVTYKGIAKGFGEKVEYNDNLESYWSNLDGLESSRAMSLVPKSAKIIWADTDTVMFIDKAGKEVKKCPVVCVGNVFILPGVPEYFQKLFTSLEKDYFQSHGSSFYTGRIFLTVYEDLVLEALNKTVAEMKDCVFGSYPVIGNPVYKTLITVEALSVDKLRVAEDFFKALILPRWIVIGEENMDNSVYRFRNSTEDPTMVATLNKSIKLVEDAFEQYNTGGLMVSFNGGKDCTALLHIVLAVKERLKKTEPLQAVYFKPANPFPEVEDFIQDTISKHKIELTTLPGPIKSALEILVQQKPDVQAIFLGTRRTDPFSHDLKDFQMTDPGWTQIMRVNPILDWSYQDIWTFLRGIAAPYCSLYDQGYTSLGNRDNTKPNPCLLETCADGTQRYRPAWMLTDDSVERNGRS